MIRDENPLLLASASPRRREILETLGVPLRVAAVAVDESVRPGEAAGAYLERVVADKLAAVTPSIAAGAAAVLVADTSVIVDGEVLGKPADAAEAAAMLRRLSGRAHEVWTRFAVRATSTGREISETVVTRVVFRALDEDEIEGYAATGEGLDKAGGYAVQGVGAFAVARVEGSYANVVGLPACEVVVALKELDLLGKFPKAR